MDSVRDSVKNNDRFDDPFMRIYFCIIRNFVRFDRRRTGNHFSHQFSISKNNSSIAVDQPINFQEQYFAPTVNKRSGRINYA